VSFVVNCFATNLARSQAFAYLDRRPTTLLCYKIPLEPITHFLTGAVLARAGFNRKSAFAMATMTLAAEAPDLDVLASFKGPVFGFAHHRGFTHSFAGLLLTSAVVVGVIYLVWILRGRKTNIPNLPPRWGLLFLFAYVAGLSHILLDFTNNYGVRPFWPFWEKWYEWGTAFILEPPMLALFVAALVLPELVGRSKPKPRGRVAAILALICVMTLWVERAYTARKIEHGLRQQTFNSEPPLRVSAYPYWSPAPRWLIELRWSAVIETRSSYVSARVNASTGALDSLVVLTKPPETPAILAAKRSYVGRVYLDWARYPMVTESSNGALSKVTFWDLRFGYPHTPRTLLRASVTLDRDLRVVGEAMGPRPQTPLLD
jgi:inner membrane protein